MKIDVDKSPYFRGIGSRIRESCGMVVGHSTRRRVIKMIHVGISSFVSIKWQAITIY
jgi:hypothetical protein